MVQKVYVWCRGLCAVLQCQLCTLEVGRPRPPSKNTRYSSWSIGHACGGTNQSYLALAHMAADFWPARLSADRVSFFRRQYSSVGATSVALAVVPCIPDMCVSFAGLPALPL